MEISIIAFLLYERKTEENTSLLCPTGENYHLAGYNLIYRAWKDHGSPINTGWHVSADELIRLHTNQEHTYDSRRLLIDFHPSSTYRIGIIELLDIYAYTFGNDDLEAEWTPMMLRLRSILYTEEGPFDKERKASILSELPDGEDSQDIVEFLYLSGWNWGRNGMTNAAFIEGEARNYFRKFF